MNSVIASRTRLPSFRPSASKRCGRQRTQLNSRQASADALSRMHDLLSQSGWQGADLQEIAHDQLAAHETSGIIISGPPVRLEPQVALHVALMMHELGTNSVKYGALSRAEGVVRLGWALSDNRLCLE